MVVGHMWKGNTVGGGEGVVVDYYCALRWRGGTQRVQC